MLERMRHALDPSDERGVTVVELLVVIILVGLMLAVAVPSYLGFRERAAANKTKANLRNALPAALAYYADKGTYVGMNAITLVATDPRVSPTLTVASAKRSQFCLTDTVNGVTMSVAGPDPSGSHFHKNADCS
ncbi:MAG TPA: type II secretion system protein [Gaiellaceae bacterium]|nr:type II secretion system protein [Gaiellaceae bacterium]